MSNKNSKRKALSDDALENVSGGLKESRDKYGYTILYSPEYGRYRLNPSSNSQDIQILKIILGSLDRGEKKYLNDLADFKKYQISSK